MSLQLYNSLTRKKEPFQELTPGKVGMYVCGPTVYDRAHIGNARSVVVYDVLFRLLRQMYGDANVTYVRNITDVDDKINAAAVANGETIQALTQRVTGWFHEDMAALNCLPPTREPRATEYIPQMIAMTQRLIANGAAYVAEGHVLFDVAQDKHYGALSGRTVEEQKAGARIEVESYKRHPGDFVLWKPTPEGDDPSSVFESPWGKGRPGWHIECSAMSTDLLGENFDIHGGGADLKFPHHENEIAQSRCSYPGSTFAETWVHNGFVTVNGEKMSKSLGNFTTVRELLDKGIHGEVIRYVFLSTHYSKPLDWSEKAVADAKKALDGFYRVLETPVEACDVPEGFIAALMEDVNVPQAMMELHAHASRANQASDGKDKAVHAAALRACGQFLGLLQHSSQAWFGGDTPAEIVNLVEARIAAKKAKDFAEADRLRALITEKGYGVEDKRDGTYEIRKL